jgi:MFS family permease
MYNQADANSSENSVESDTPIVTHEPPNIILKMSQIKTQSDTIIIYGGMLLLGIIISTVLISMLQIEWKITSSFQAFDIGPIITIIKGLLGTLIIPLFSNLSNIYGRAPIYTCVILIWVIGNFYMSSSSSFLNYSIGSIIGGLGETGNTLLVPIILADFLSPKNRGFGFILYTLPDLIALGVSLPVIEIAERDENWRLLFNIFGGLLLVFASPVIITLFKLQVKARRLVPKFNSKISLLGEVDWLGILLLTISLSAILIPFSLVVKFDDGWKSPSIYTPILLGALFFIGFLIWSLKYSKNSIISPNLIQNRGAITMVIIRSLLFFDSNLTWTYMSPYLSLTRNLDQYQVSQIYLGFRLSWHASGFLMAFILRKYTKSTRLLVQISLAVNALGVGLALGSRSPQSPVWSVILAETLIGLGSGSTACAGLVILQSTVEFSDIANISALDDLLSTIFGTVSIALANTIWNLATYNNLINRLPSSLHGLIPELIASNKYNELLPIEFKENWVLALGDTQWLMCTISTILAVICFVISCCLPQVDLDKCQLVMNSSDCEEREDDEVN